MQAALFRGFIGIMSKFTIFTVILSISVVTVTADLAMRDYFAESQANVLGGEEISPVISDPADAAKEEEGDLAGQGQGGQSGLGEQNELSASASQQISASAATAQSAVPPTVIPPPSATITQELIRQADFSGSLSEKAFNGRIFQLLDITKNPVDGMSLYEISENGVAVVSITEIAVRDEIRALQLYMLLQNKTKPYIDLSLNETNAYGDRSFYVNHAKKPDEAFLIVKIGKMLYSFAYVKSFHPQVKKLIVLLSP